jgi:hypothetical protein
MQSQQTQTRKRLKPRSPYAVELRRLGQKVKPSKKRYTRKGRSQNRPFDVWGGWIVLNGPLALIAVRAHYTYGEIS